MEPQTYRNNGNGKITEAQKKAIKNLGKLKGYSPADLNRISLDWFGSEVPSLPAEQASQFIVQLQQKDGLNMQ